MDCPSGDRVDVVCMWEENQNGYLVAVAEAGTMPLCFRLLGYTRKLDFSVTLIFRN